MNRSDVNSGRDKISSGHLNTPDQQFHPVRPTGTGRSPASTMRILVLAIGRPIGTTFLSCCPGRHCQAVTSTAAVGRTVEIV